MGALWNRMMDALQSSVKTWAIVLVAVSGLALWAAIEFSVGHANRSETKRWQAGGMAIETKMFKEYVHHEDTSAAPPRALYHQISQEATSKKEEQDAPIPPNPNTDWSLPRVAVYSAPNIQPPHTRPTLRDLGGQAQARAIEFLGQSTPQGPHRWDDLRQALSDDEKPGERDPYLFERVLVASVTKGAGWQPSDRMVWTRTFVQPINFRFAAYTIAATESETVKVSSVESTNVRKLSADFALTIPGLEGPKVDLGPSRENTTKTTRDISTQYERLGVDIMPEFLRIVRESVAGGNVLGNTKVALSVVTDPGLIQRTFPKDEEYRPVDTEVALVVTDIHLDDDENPKAKGAMKVVPQAPLPHCALRARVWAVYEQRHVYGGDEYYDESRQRVVLIRSADEKKDVDIVGADDVSPMIWKIQIVKKGEKPSIDWGGDNFLKAKLENGMERELVFSDHERATKLAYWVRTNPGEKAADKFIFNYRKGDSQAGSGLVVIKNLNNDCRATNKPKGILLVGRGMAGAE